MSTVYRGKHHEAGRLPDTEKGLKKVAGLLSLLYVISFRFVHEVGVNEVF